MAFPVSGKEISIIGIAASNVASAVLRFYGEWFARPKYLVDSVKSLSIPRMSEDLTRRISRYVEDRIEQSRRGFQEREPFLEFTSPSYLSLRRYDLSAQFEYGSLLGVDLDAAVARAYGLNEVEERQLCSDLMEALEARESTTGQSLDLVDDEADQAEIHLDDDSTRFQDLLSYAVGCVLGRWDARIGKDPALATILGDAFDPLPICSPGMLSEDAALVGIDGPLPYRPERLHAKPKDIPADYPIAIEWSGLLVDEELQPKHDLVARVQGVLAYLFEERAEAIEQEACDILKVKGLREYFRRPASFFAHHLAQYSKSRRQAPIYWPLSTQSGGYTIWVYYHRLTSDTLFTAVNRYVLPKLSAVEREVAELGARLNGASGREATGLREEIERAQALRGELAAFRDELLRVAALPYNPNLNDGVIINAAPLYRLFRLPKWAKDTKECWTKLERGDYDWAHLAYTIWPTRVAEKCRADKSLAIAHGLEDLYIEPPATAKKRRAKVAVVQQPALDGEDEDDG